MKLPHVSLAGFASALAPERMPAPDSILGKLLLNAAQLQAHTSEHGQFRGLIRDLERGALEAGLQMPVRSTYYERALWRDSEIREP